MAGREYIGSRWEIRSDNYVDNDNFYDFIRGVKYKDVNHDNSVGQGVIRNSDIADRTHRSTIHTHCSFDKMNKLYRDNLLRINIKQNHIRCGYKDGLDSGEFDAQRKTLTEFDNLYNVSPCAVTNNMGGLSTHITMEKLSYDYIEDNDYTDRFAKTIHGEERQGVNASQKADHTTKTYPNKENLYHDDNNTLTLTDSKIKYNGCDTILKKTKDLFKERKINSIISRFYTEGDTEDSFTDGTAQVRGMSHGRNLLQKRVESEFDVNAGYHINGYNNPYCRVWTHHYQYDQIGKAMRPFSIMDKEGKPTGIGTNHIEFHKWELFQKKNTDKLQHWKNNKSWNYSVFNKDNGLVNIHPYYDDQTSDKSKQVHTRQCMFSIENLAWKDYDPFSFEQALSWEQRGPNGGRIMWFPPYNLKISENSNPQWEANTFIGRGESVYTYKNTERTGTIEFTLLIDHPSLLDYLSMRENKMYHEGNVTDADLHRFFAGCDTGVPTKDGVGNPNPNGYTLLNFVQPTHLDDETPEKKPKEKKPEVKPEPKPEPPKKEEVVPEEDTLKISFCAFYPNNYSGFYDRELNRNVEPIAYLLAGNGANVVFDEMNIENTQDIECRFSNLPQTNVGYEVRNNVNEGISSDKTLKDSKNYLGRVNLIGQAGKKLTLIKSGKTKVSTTPYYYRVDYTYKPYKDKKEETYNTANQKLLKDKDYKDEKSFGFNYSVDNSELKEYVKSFVENDNIFSLYEVACAIAILSNYTSSYPSLNGIGNVDISQKPSDEDIDKKNGLLGRIYYLVKIFSEYELKHFEGYGFSNSHGNNANETTNKNRNIKLADERYKSVSKWLKQHYGGKWAGIEDKMTERKPSTSTNTPKKADNVDGVKAKLYRSATCTMVFKGVKKSENMSDLQKPNINGDNNPNVGSDNPNVNPTPSAEQEQFDKTLKSFDVLSEIGQESNNKLLELFGQRRPFVMTDKSIVVFNKNNPDTLVLFDKEFDTKTNFDLSTLNGNVDKFNTQVETINAHGLIEVEKINYLNSAIENIKFDDQRLKSFDGIEPILKHVEGYIKKDDDTINVMFLPNSNLHKLSTQLKAPLTIEDNGDSKEANLSEGLKETGHKDPSGNSILEDNNGDKYIIGADGGLTRLNYTEQIVDGDYPNVTVDRGRNKDGHKPRIEERNYVRYDQEYRFFKMLERTSPTNFKKLTEKIQYFDPAFHSMSPEGFNARLTFLHQCTRQGPTKTRGDIAGGTANNLAFGRPPFIVLRVGDFWHQLCIITGLSITYPNDTVWDFNVEGSGVQPMFANVNMSITFLGGGSLEGVIPRLQNAITFNYYANTGLYDNRADKLTDFHAQHIPQVRDKSKNKYYSFMPEFSKEFKKNLDN